MTAALIARSTAQAVSLAMQGELLTRSTSTSAVESKKNVERSDTIIQSKLSWDLNEISEVKNDYNVDNKNLISSGPVLEKLQFAKDRYI